MKHIFIMLGLWLSFTVGAMAQPVIDQSGTATCAGCGGSTTGPAITISTTGNNELVILSLYGNRSGTGTAMTWTPSGCGVTWHSRAIGIGFDGNRHPLAVQEFWGAVTGGALSACTVTTTASASQDAGTIVQFSLTGVASLTSPFDANVGGTPQISGDSSNPPSAIVTTSQSAFIYSMGGSTANNNGSLTALASTALIGDTTDGAHGQNAHGSVYGGSFSGFQSRLSCCTTGGNSQQNGAYVVDAVAGTGGSGSTAFPPDSHVDLDQYSEATCGNCGGTTQGPGIAITTSGANELVLVAISGNASSTGSPITWTPSGCGLSWTLRGTGLWSDSNGSPHPAAVQLYWAWAASQVTQCIVTTTASVNEDAGSIIQFSLANVASSITPFDANGSLPSLSAANAQPPDAVISTNGQGFMFSVITNDGNCLCGSAAAVSGESLIAFQVDGEHSQDNYIGLFGGTYNTAQTSFTCCTTGNSGFNNQGLIVDSAAGAGAITSHSHIIIGMLPLDVNIENH